MKKYANKFQHLYTHLTKSSISWRYRIEHFLSRLKEDVQNKVLVDSRGDGALWDDIKHLINDAVTIDTIFTQVAKGERRLKILLKSNWCQM